MINCNLESSQQNTTEKLRRVDYDMGILPTLTYPFLGAFGSLCVAAGVERPTPDVEHEKEKKRRIYLSCFDLRNSGEDNGDVLARCGLGCPPSHKAAWCTI